MEDYFSQKQADFYFQIFQHSLHWQSGEFQIFGKTYPKPRLEAFYAENELQYSYSGKALLTNSFTDDLLKIKETLEQDFDLCFNSVLANFYRDGKDSNGWHADNEKELGKNPTIASISFGQARKFDLKHNSSKEKLSFDLKPGSLLIMGGELQHFWKHQLAKTKKEIGPRINLTFRYVV